MEQLKTPRWITFIAALCLTFLAAPSPARAGDRDTDGDKQREDKQREGNDDRRSPVIVDAARMISQGRHTFRFNTFGDEAFWSGLLGLNAAIAGAAHGGIGPGLSPAQALALGLKVDATA